MIDAFKKLSSIISNIGKEHFPLATYELLESYVCLDAMGIFRLTEDAPSGQYRMQCYGSVSSESTSAKAACCVHGEGNAGTERPFPYGKICDKSKKLIQDGQKSAIVYESHHTGNQLLRYAPASRRSSDYHIILVRMNHTHCHFSSIELNLLKDLLGVLLQLIDQHIEALACDGNYPLESDPQGDGITLLARKFDARLEQRGLILSKREKQACVMVLAGKTLPIIAKDLSLNDSTVATYLKRASLKLGVSGRHGFIKWMQGT